MTLPDIIKLIQGETGTVRDGVFGPVSAAATLAALQARHAEPHGETPIPAASADAYLFDPRSEATIATLDPKAQPMFRRFLALAKATAATMGCDYRLISGYRSWAEQDALYAQGRTAPGSIVTNAPGGYSFHNLKVGGDGGVFRGERYIEEGNAADQALAERVHEACAVHAAPCGLVWGGSWKGFRDTPHWNVDVGHSSPTSNDRAIFQAKGSIL